MKHKALFIRGNRNGYSPEQCGRTMTVGELIEYLEEFDEDAPIYLCNDGGYTYGSVERDDIWNGRYDDGEDDDEEE